MPWSSASNSTGKNSSLLLLFFIIYTIVFLRLKLSQKEGEFRGGGGSSARDQKK